MLIVGRWNAALAEYLTSAGCTLAALCLERDAANAASPSCSTVETLDVTSWAVPESILGRPYDAVVVDGALELCPNPESLLSQIQTTIGDGGFVAALLPHTAHGAIRLALMRGIPTEAFAGVASAHEAIELFERSGYSIRKVDRILAPLFGQRDGLPSLEQSNFEPSVVQEIQSDPESETASFLVLADLGVDAAPDAADTTDAVTEDDRFAVAFETAFEAQRRRTQLEEELRAALQEVDRLRGRVIALEDALHDQAERHEKSDKARKK